MIYAKIYQNAAWPIIFYVSFLLLLFRFIVSVSVHLQETYKYNQTPHKNGKMLKNNASVWQSCMFGAKTAAFVAG